VLCEWSNIEVPAERDRIIEMFAEMDFSTALKSFALLDSSPKMEALKAEALKQGQTSPLSAMMGIKHLDDEGKTVVKTAGAGSGEPPDEGYLDMIARAESLRRAMVVANNIEPVRVRINDTIAIEERHFNPIVWQSAFVPQLQAPLYALGFARLFQGDFASAAHSVSRMLPVLDGEMGRMGASGPGDRGARALTCAWLD
jgi:hypothetical protein